MSNIFKNNKYKDCDPIETILTIRKLLDNLKIIAIEKEWLYSRNIYIVDLMIPSSGIHVYGEGTDYYQALSDSYIKLIGGLQNFSFFSTNHLPLISNEKSLSFTWAPDEIIDNDSNNLESISLPFMDTSTNTLINIHTDNLTNIGMCAGNTKEEALVTGLCKIIEEYVYNKINNNEITPPPFPKSYINKFPWINELLKRVDRETNKKIVLLDCSLGLGYPVVGAMTLDIENRQCQISLGCHPIFEIAAEKSIITLVSKIYIKKRTLNTLADQYRYHIYQQKHLLYHDYDYSYKPFPLEDADSNKRLFTYLYNLLQLKDFHLYIRDLSFLGFHSYHLVVPELIVENNKNNQLYNRYLTLKNIITEKPLIQSLDSIIQNFDLLFINIEDVFNIELEQIPWYYTNIGMNLVMCLLPFHNYALAADLLQRMIPYYNDDSQQMKSSCLLESIRLKEQNLKNTDIEKTMSFMYNSKLTKEVIYLLDRKHPIAMNCYECKGCYYKKICSYPSKKNIYKIIKDKYAENPIGQLSLTYNKIQS